MKEKAAEVKARLVANAKEVNGVKVVKAVIPMSADGSGSRGAFSGRGRCAGGGAAAANQQAGSHTGNQDSGYLLLHGRSPSFCLSAFVRGRLRLRPL